MAKEISCPECGSINIKIIPYKAAVGPAGPHGELPKEEQYEKYECLDCGMVFFESDLLE
jgi:DNA-directed RNA polymerase subunit RPC12/RpoP